jgi:fatty aldehyde decarbonylase
MELEEKLKDPGYKCVVSDIFSQAIVCEIIGMKNFATISSVIDDYDEAMEAIEHANGERMHAEGFLALAKEYDLEININLNGIYWNGIRERVIEYGNRKDFVACFIVQEIMLESYAVSMYTDVGNKLPGKAGSLFLAIAEEEKSHLHHAIEILQKEYHEQGEAVVRKLEKVHYECMTILSEWSGRTDHKGHCGICKGTCMKESLPQLDLDIVSLRGNALNLYVKMLDEIGIPTDETLPWIANLPA